MTPNIAILGIILAWLGTLAWQRVGPHSPYYGRHWESAFRRCKVLGAVSLSILKRCSEVRHEGSMAHDVRAVARLAFLVAAVAALGSLFSYELLRAIADRLAPDGNAANLDRALHAAIVVYLRAIAVAAAIAAGSLLAGGPAVASRLATPRSGRAPTLVWTVVFVIVLLGVQLWYLDFVKGDESTFIIMGSHVLEGHLPYLELFDIKPPGIYFALAGVMSVFGENLLAVRFFGTFCLLVSAIAGYAIAIRQTTPLIAGASMAVFCALTGVSAFQPMMTEHLMIALMMPACWLLVARRDQLWAAFLIGVLLSAATLTRTNIAFVVLALGGFYVWRFVRPRPDVPPLAIAAYGVGGALPLAPLLLLYWLAGGLDVFVLSVIRVPLSYASQEGMAAVMLAQISNWRSFVQNDPYIFLACHATHGHGAGDPCHQPRKRSSLRRQRSVAPGAWRRVAVHTERRRGVGSLSASSPSPGATTCGRRFREADDATAGRFAVSRALRSDRRSKPGSFRWQQRRAGPSRTHPVLTFACRR